MTQSLCRISKTPLTKVLDFGRQPLGNGFLLPDEFDAEYFYQMEVGFSETSMMLQLINQPPPELMFHSSYAFFSSTSTRMSTHFQLFAEQVLASRFLTSKDPFVVELGCNDGILLKNFAGAGIRHIGIEPSTNVAQVAVENGVRVITEFFNEATAETITAQEGRADIFLAANVMCHIPDLHEVIRGIRRLIKPSGVAIFEDPYLGDVFEKISYDQIYDEHVFLFSAHSIRFLFELHGMELIDVQPQATHGGSMRYTVGNKGAHQVRDTVAQLIEKEQAQGIHRLTSYAGLRAKVEESKREFVLKLRDLSAAGKRVVGYGATSKSTTILNYCGIGPDLVSYISDTTPIKQGKFTPGTHIPVVPYETFKLNPPDYAILFAWNHAEEILSKERLFVASGGKWISHVPSVRVL
jgi:2-polyprenyl-3-methyl-5-hydroxy-6-metoxy-1,4-benzoquinol methylase